MLTYISIRKFNGNVEKYSAHNPTIKEVDIMTTEKEVKVTFAAKGKTLSEIVKQILISKAR